VHKNTSSYYLSLLCRPTHEKERHGSCTWEQCLIDQVDSSTYETKHAAEPCSCLDAVTEHDMQQVNQLVRERKTPTITVSEKAGTLDLDILVQSSSPQSPFVAISHVWSDGLGNKLRNSLPRC
jgi:hypothetical protein